MAKCASCDADIEWCVSLTSGKRIPLDAVPVAEGGNVYKVGRNDEESGAPIVAFDKRGVHLPIFDGEPRYVSHFATCPNSDEWRKSRGSH